MAGEDDMRPLLGGDAQEIGLAIHFDALAMFGFGVEVENLVKEEVFTGEPGHVAPHIGGDLLDFASDFSGKA
jgi:hypothetical protein